MEARTSPGVATIRYGSLGDSDSSSQLASEASIIEDIRYNVRNDPRRDQFGKRLVGVGAPPWMTLRVAHGFTTEKPPIRNTTNTSVKPRRRRPLQHRGRIQLIEPRPASIIDDTRLANSKRGARTFTASISSMMAASVSTASSRTAAAALFTKTSTLPSASRACRPIASGDATSAMSPSKTTGS